VAELAEPAVHELWRTRRNCLNCAWTSPTSLS